VTEPATQAARLAENEARFRQANERVGAAARRLEIDRALPFVCECGRPDCMTIIRVLPADYERVRAVSTHFIYAPGHERDLPQSRALERLEGAVVVEKVGDAARVAQETDPRGSD
jgi:hypothetical protein